MLYIIPTPIGNLKDFTDRAKETLSQADFLIAENPTYSQRLLKYFSIPPKPIFQFAEHNELKVLDKLLERLKSSTGALITDAGTPGVSDPGFRLISACVKSNIKVEALPGPSAFLTALSASGLPTDKFLFLGFLGKTEHQVIKSLSQAKDIQATAIFYESPERITKTLKFIETNFTESRVVVARELTKIHEEYLRGTAGQILEEFQKKPSVKGEMTVLVSFK